MKILITSVGRRSYLVKYFKKAIGDDGEIHVSNSTSLSPAFKEADKAVVTPLIYDDSYISFLIKYCKDNQIDAIISLFDVDLPILSKNKKLFNDNGIKVVVSDIGVIDICNDKYKTFKFLLSNGFYTPKTYLNVDEVIEEINRSRLNYPLIIKPRWGMGSIGIYTAENEDELRVLYNKTINTIKKTYLKYESSIDIDKSVIIQEKIEGQEYGLDVINDLNGNYQNTIVKLKYRMRAGETDCAITLNDNKLKTLGKCISGSLKHIANLDVDVIMAGENPYVLEMNARFGGGYPFSHASGVNLPEAIVKWLQGQKVEKTLLQEKSNILYQKDIVLIPIDVDNQ